MNRSMITAAVTMGQLQQRLDNISNNISNINTNGYKRRDVQFGELLVQQINNQRDEHAEDGRLTPNGIRSGVGAKVAATNMRLEPGAIVQTGRELDVAISNPSHFFQIQVTEGGQAATHYTRDGAFYLTENPDNPGLMNLVTGEGNYVMGENGPITVPAYAENLTISQNGEVVVQSDGNRQTVGRLQLMEITRPKLLEQAGGNRLRLTDVQGIEPEDVLQLVAGAETNVQQGALEGSNVDLSQEMTQLMTTQRSYQFNARSITMSDQMMGLINGLR